MGDRVVVTWPHFRLTSTPGAVFPLIFLSLRRIIISMVVKSKCLSVFAPQLKGNLLLVYGTGDDNCHFQNCQVLVNALVKHNKHFTMMAYPNRSHSIDEGTETSRHLYELLTKYLMIISLPDRSSVRRGGKRYFESILKPIQLRIY